tara:strand:+ start:783 stop:1556 length:774 start_codon:yes stop_codon:yes gene_type:complete
MSDIVIFWHICQLQHWKQVVMEQYKILQTSGILDACHSVQIGYIGHIDHIQFLLNMSHKFKIYRHSQYYFHYERITLNSIIDFVHDQNNSNCKNILYLHSKGVTRHPHSTSIKQWRLFMQYFLIQRFRDVLPLLNNYDVVGCNIHNEGNSQHKIDNEQHCIHYSGNFWWASVSYLKNMKKIPEYPKNMKSDYLFWLCERWILYKLPNCKAIEVFTTGKKHFYKEKNFLNLFFRMHWNPQLITFCTNTNTLNKKVICF